ncbi:MAG: hypothetical protein R3A43_01960 [Bacteroidia bacterium]
MSGQSNLNQVDKLGHKNGLWIKMNELGRITELTDYYGGVKNGFSFRFDSLGQIISDSLFELGKLLNADSIFKDSANRTKIKGNYTGLDPNPAFMDEKYAALVIAYKDGYAHGITLWKASEFGPAEIFIKFWGLDVYNILVNEKGQSVYYSLAATYYPYQITKCLASKHHLMLEISNPNNCPINVPSLKSRTLRNKKNKLYHELYYIWADTLYVKLNPKHDRPGHIPFPPSQNKKNNIKTRIVFRHRRFMEILLAPKATIKQKVKIYTHDIYPPFIVLEIDGRVYVFQNNPFMQENPVDVRKK